MKKIVLIILVLYFNTEILFSQSTQINKIELIVIDGETHLPIEQVIVNIAELKLKFLTDKNGNIFFEKSNIEKYTISLERIGYRANQIILSSRVIENKTKHIFHLFAIPIQSGGVIITGEHNDISMEGDAQTKIVLEGKELQRDLSTTLASTLKNELGVAMRSMGPAPSRPVLRGLGGDRIVIAEDGIKNDDLSATSPDHAVTIEPFTIDRIEIIRGPKVLLSTPVSLGGIIQVVRDEIPLKKISRITGNAGFFGESVNKGILGAATILIPIDKFNFRGEISSKKAKNISSPIGELKNSAFEVLNYSVGTSFVDHNFSFGVSAREYQTSYGIPGGFVGAHPNGVDIDIFKRQIQARGKIIFDDEEFPQIEFNLSRLYLSQQEFEKKGLIGADFFVKHLTFNAQLIHNEVGLLHSGTFGLTAEERDYKIGGLVFTPTTNMQNVALSFFESWIKNNFTFQIGGRTDISKITPSKMLKPTSDEIKKRNFWITSFSGSILYDFSDVSHYGFTFSKSSRVPTIEELFSQGPHLAAYSYEIGNPNLENEKGFGAEIFYHFNDDKFSFMSIGFVNYFENFIMPRNSGEKNWATLLPIYKTVGVPAVFKGLELEMKYEATSFLKTNLSFSYTNGIFNDSKNSLPNIPPLKILFSTEWKFKDVTFGTQNEFASKQNNVDEFEMPTDSYWIMNIHAQYLFVKETNIYSFSLNIDNVFNIIYRNHLSRIKSIMPEAGRNFRMIFRTYF